MDQEAFRISTDSVYELSNFNSIII